MTVEDIQCLGLSVIVHWKVMSYHNPFMITFDMVYLLDDSASGLYSTCDNATMRLHLAKADFVSQ